MLMKCIELVRFFWLFWASKSNLKTFSVQAAFGEILITIRERREKEFQESQNCYIAKYDNYEIDPAMLDKELEMKLMENRKNGKSIAEAINEWVNEIINWK